jgi:hypothetical protein
VARTCRASVSTCAAAEAKAASTPPGDTGAGDERYRLQPLGLAPSVGAGGDSAMIYEARMQREGLGGGRGEECMDMCAWVMQRVHQAFGHFAQREAGAVAKCAFISAHLSQFDSCSAVVATR